MKLCSSVTASCKRAVRFAESDKALDAAHVKAPLLKEPVVRADSERVPSENHRHPRFPRAGAERIVGLNAALVGQTLAERLARLFVTEIVNTVDVLIQQLGHDVIQRL